MKRILPISISLLLLAILLPLLLLSSDSAPPDASPEPSEAAPTVTPPSITLDPSAPEGSLDAAAPLTVLIDSQVQEINMFDFLAGVIAAEMPASFAPEALKAQAVAARTYTLYKLFVAPSDAHPDAYVCNDPGCCKAYKATEALMDQWGEQFDQNMQAMYDAVRETDGEILVYEDEPILAAFHSSSSGRTEASGDLWQDLPYLQSVKSFEDEDAVPNYYSAVELTYDEFQETIASAFPQADLSGPYDQWIADIVYTPTERIASLAVGGVGISGADFRTAFSLRSTAISFSFSDLGITIACSGYGHGIGMSQDRKSVV